ncbi:MAG: hypothetical protein U5K71_09470 [Gracilimonas sp.]|nr:hypothetical protein [Gracilimonas sp.]
MKSKIFHKIKVNRMVHDVTDEEVEEEIERTLEREGNWENVDEAATDESKLIVDVETLDEKGNPVKGDVDEGSRDRPCVRMEQLNSEKNSPAKNPVMLLKWSWVRETKKIASALPSRKYKS